MRIAIIGAVVYDEIFTHDGARRESFGGITYNIAALSSIVGDEATIRPIANVAEDRWDDVVALLARYPQVEMQGVARVPGKLTATRLIYTSPTWRDETVLHMMRPLTAERLAAARDADAVLVNFVNGTEMTLATFADLRGGAPPASTAPPGGTGTDQAPVPARPYLHVDVHSKVARWDARGKKEIVPFADWREWLGRADAAQMNEFECEMIVGRKLREQSDFVAAGAEIVAAGAPIVLITLGPLGSVLVYDRGRLSGAGDQGAGAAGQRGSPVGEGDLRWVANPALAVEKVVDTTGCGDSFSAGFMWSYLQSGDPVKANAAANIVAGVNCTVAGIGHLEAARGALDQVPAAFPGLGAKIAAGWPGEQV
jgi:adenosine kinase